MSRAAMVNINENDLQCIIKSIGLSQRYLGKLLNLSTGTVNFWVRSKRIPVIRLNELRFFLLNISDKNELQKKAIDLINKYLEVYDMITDY